MSPKPKNPTNLLSLFVASFNLLRSSVFRVDKIIDIPAYIHTDELQNLQIQSRDRIEFAQGDTFDVKLNKRKETVGDSMERCRVEKRCVLHGIDSDEKAD